MPEHLSKARRIGAAHAEEMKRLGTVTLAKEMVTGDNQPSEIAFAANDA